MKKVFLFFASLVLLTSCRIDISGNKGGDNAENVPRVSRNIQVANFESVTIYGSPTVCYKQGELTDVVIKGRKSAVEAITAEVSDGNLVIQQKSRVNFFNQNDGLVVEISSPDLVGIILNGSGDFNCLTALDSDTLKVNLQGSGDIKFHDIVTDVIDIDLIGSGGIDFGTVNAYSANINLQGSGDINATFKDTKSLQVSLMGTGDVDLEFNNCEEATCNLQGSGDIKISGTLRKLSEHTSGSGSIKKKKLNVSGNQ